MSRNPLVRVVRPRPLARAVALLVGLLAAVSVAGAATTGRIQGRIAATDSGEPVGFADVLLIPADTTLQKVGGLTNADGTYLLEAAPGTYTLQIRSLSYATKRIEGIVITAGQVLPFSTALSPEAIQQEEIVVEGKVRQNTEASMLSVRRKATSVGDAVSAEQVRRSPDKDAAEVLRRVTGLSVSDGKYVFVRGLGERYSSTEVDGVRIASPEQNKRVVPLDLLPANLIENIVVQKTYTADRPGEFGGGDVQVRTKDFPDGRTWSLSVSQGAVDGVTFQDRRTYAGSGADLWGFGASSRGLPGAIPRDRSLDESNTSISVAERAAMARSFRDVWSPTAAHTVPNGGYSLTYGDEFKLFGRPLGLIESWSLARSFAHRRESQRGFRSASADSLYDYDVDRSTESVQLGGISGLSYRLSPRHSIHLRGLYDNSADDEVRVYEGTDFTRDSDVGHLGHRGTRLMYTQRTLTSGSMEGQHDVQRLFGTHVDWKLTRSRARRQQPDRREVIYDRRNQVNFDTGEITQVWQIGSQGQREFGDLHDRGSGATVTASVPYGLGGLGKGKVTFGVDQQTKNRDNSYRRFALKYPSDPTVWESGPDTLFGPGSFDGSPTTGYLIETTYNSDRYTDNYRARQRVRAGFVGTDVPFGHRARGTFGLRVEQGYQDVQSYDLFDPSHVYQEGRLDDTDWLPSANLTLAMTDAINVRLAASRTLSRPDLNELSPSPSLEYEAGSLVLGNSQLKRAVIDNYDARFEAFPSLGEVFAAGFFYKQLHQPIERVIRGSSDQLVYPQNSDQGHNVGVELEARSSLGRVWRRLGRFSVNTNASFIRSEVFWHGATNGSGRHPLEGQADYLVNAGLIYASPAGRAEASVLVSATGKRLRELGFLPLPDVYEQPLTTLDATVGGAPFAHTRVKFAAKNILDRRTQLLQGTHEVSGYRTGRAISLALSYGS